jgi:protein transport protein SEC31
MFLEPNDPIFLSNNLPNGFVAPYQLFGGKLISVSNLSSAQGKNQSSLVHIRKVVTEHDLVERVKKLQGVIGEESLQSFAEEKTTNIEGRMEAST